VEMAEVNQITVKTVSIHQLKNDVVKFDGINNFGMWRYEVMGVLGAQNLEGTLELQEKIVDILEKDWKKLNKTSRGIIRYCLTHDLKYHVMNEISAKSI